MWDLPHEKMGDLSERVVAMELLAPLLIRSVMLQFIGLIKTGEYVMLVVWYQLLLC